MPTDPEVQRTLDYINLDQGEYDLVSYLTPEAVERMKTLKRYAGYDEREIERLRTLLTEMESDLKEVLMSSMGDGDKLALIRRYVHGL